MYSLLAKAALPLSLLSTHLVPSVSAASNDTDDEQPAYQACPLINAYYPPPTLNRSSDALRGFAKDFAAQFHELVASGGSEDFGEITPNTTSFSVVLFSGNAGTPGEESIFAEYHYTAPAAASSGRENVTLDTPFPLGGLTQVLTVYAWLVEMGDGEWEAPVTKYLPELSAAAANASGDDFVVDWDGVTIGALAGHMSGLARDSYACELGTPCNFDTFVEKFATQPPVFLPDTTPMFSNAAFQLLAFALERNRTTNDTADIYTSTLLAPLGMNTTSLLTADNAPLVFAGAGASLNASQPADPSALALLSTTHDLALLGHSILSSALLSPATTRRWLHPTSSTSNLRNAAGRPWEIYHASSDTSRSASPIIDIYTKTGLLPAGSSDGRGGGYASYFGLTPDFAGGFAILAHDSEAARPDLNVYADVVSLAIGQLAGLAAKQAAVQYAGVFAASDDNDDSVAVFNVTRDGPGLVVGELRVGGVDVRAQVADKAGISRLEDLDFRVYPSNVGTGGKKQQFVAVYQDRSALVDMGTPTCITWQDVGALGLDVPGRFVFELGESGRAESVSVSGMGEKMARMD